MKKLLQRYPVLCGAAYAAVFGSPIVLWMATRGTPGFVVGGAGIFCLGWLVWLMHEDWKEAP